MSVDDAIVTIFNHKLFKDLCKKYGGNNWQDLRSEVILMVCELPEEKKGNIVKNNYLLPYALNIIKNQAHTNEWTRFRKLYGNREGLLFENTGKSYFIESDHHTEKVSCYNFEKDVRDTKIIDKVISNAINPTDDKHYYAYLMIENANDMPLREIAANLGVPLASVWKGIQQYKEHVNQWLKSAI